MHKELLKHLFNLTDVLLHRIKAAFDLIETFIDLVEAFIDLVEAFINLGEAFVHLGETFINPLVHPIETRRNVLRLSLEGVLKIELELRHPSLELLLLLFKLAVHIGLLLVDLGREPRLQPTDLLVEGIASGLELFLHIVNSLVDAVEFALHDCRICIHLMRTYAEVAFVRGAALELWRGSCSWVR